MTRVSDFCESDIDFIASAREAGFSDGWNKSMLLSAINGGRFHALIAEENGERIGFITYSEGFDGVFDLEDLFVLPSQRKKGAGGALVSEFIDRARALGGKKIFLEVRKSNAVAVALYGKSGFEKISERAKYYADGETAAVMLKEI